MPDFYNMDCREGAKAHLADNSIDLIITDPPYGIAGDTLHKHYNRDESFVIDGYIDVPADEYASFSREWIHEAARVLRPGGTAYIVSGYTNLRHILNALAETDLTELNHIIWKYNFGVYTKRKYISSHYHILCYVKPGQKHTFNTHARFGANEENESGGKANYSDREDVWVINREYKPGKAKNKNELPRELLTKMILYSSNEGDTVCDFFLGSFSTAKTAIGLGRKACGFELSKSAFTHQMKEVANIRHGELLSSIRVPEDTTPVNQGKPFTPEERQRIRTRFDALIAAGNSKKAALAALTPETGRGYWSLLKVVNGDKR